MTGGDPRRLSLRVVLVGCFMFVALLPIAFLSAQRYYRLADEQFREDLQQDTAIARAVAAGLSRFMAARAHLINVLAEDLGALGIDNQTAVTRELDVVRRRNPAFRSLIVVDQAGAARAASPATGAQGRSVLGERYDDRLWFLQTLTSPRDPSFDVVSGRAMTGPTIAVAAPIRSRTGATVGILAGGLDLEALRRSIGDIDIGGVGRLAVVDARGRVIAHTSAAWEAEAHDLSSEAVFIAAKRQPEGSVQYQSSFTGEQRWGSYIRMPSTGWVLWFSRGPDQWRPKVHRLLRDLVVSGAIAIIIAGLAAVVVSGALARPLRVLADATRDVSARGFPSGELLPAPTVRVREFEWLLTGFREMARALRADYEGLEAQVAERTRALEQRTREAHATTALLRAQEGIQRGYGELAALLNSLDRSYVLEEGTKKIASTIQAPLAAVYLTEDGPDGLRLKTYAAVDSAAIETGLLAPGGLPREVGRRRDLIVLSGTEGAEPLQLRTGAGIVEVAAVVGLPLTYQDRFLGVLVVASLHPLSERTQQFLDDAARQLSVALNNAALFESIRYQSQQMEVLNAQLQQATEVKSQFLASMSHELRTPLNSILGFTELLLTSTRDAPTERQRAALERVRESGKHLLSLINDVLDLSKIEAGRMDVQAEPMAVPALILECIGTIEPQAHAKGLGLRTVGVEAVLPLVQDRGKVKQILINLLSNAVKFTAAGSIELRVEIEPEGFVAIAVADTGSGISLDDQSMIFDAFRQVGSSETHDAGGTGLGLAISRRLAQLMGGTLTVESAPGRGSVFTLRLPVRYGATTVDALEAAEVQAGGARVLVIDDDRHVVEILREALAGEPLCVEWAAGASEGLAHVRDARPDVILLDVMLQGHDDGWDLLDTIKADPATRAIPVIVHSVIDNPARARRLGADDVLVKPTPPAAMKALLRRILDPRRAGV